MRQRDQTDGDGILHDMLSGRSIRRLRREDGPRADPMAQRAGSHALSEVEWPWSPPAASTPPPSRCHAYPPYRSERVRPCFTEFANVEAILYSIAAVGVGAAGMGVVTINGNLFMLSMGATAAVSTVLFASLIRLGLAPTVALVVSAGLLAGLLQGALIAFADANPIITTIAASSIISGIGVLWTGGLTVVGTGDASWLGSPSRPMGAIRSSCWPSSR